jgi:outer membrane protein OmpA-like peptidoglycan-associated protein
MVSESSSQQPADEKDGPNGHEPDGSGGGGGGGEQRTLGAQARDALITKVIPFLLSTAFVGALGAAITWLHFWTAGLPAGQATRHLTVDERIIPGAETLIVFVGLGALAVAVAYAIDPPGRPTPGMRHGLLLLITVEVLLAIALAHQSARQTVTAVVLTVVVGALAQLMSYYPAHIDKPAGSDPTVSEERNAATKLRDLVMKPIPRRLRFAGKARIATEGDKTWYERDVTGAGYIASFVAMAVAWGLAFRFFAKETAWNIVVACLLAVLVFRICRLTRTFWPYGLAVFASVALFGALFISIRLLYTPQVGTVAFVRKAGPPGNGIIGLYVGQDEHNYWYGRVRIGCDTSGAVSTRPIRGSGSITSIAKDDVVHAIGTPTRLPDANGRALDMLDDLVATQQAASPKSATDAGKGTNAERTAAATLPAVRVSCNPCPHPHLTGAAPRRGGRDGQLQASGKGLGTSGHLTLDGAPLAVDEWTSTAIVFRLGTAQASGTLIADCGSLSNALHVTLSSGPGGSGKLAAHASAVPIRSRSSVFRLDASASSAPGASIVAWHWQAQHGRIIGPDRGVAIYAMPSPPTATDVVLTVTDDLGRTAKVTMPIHPDAAIVARSTAVLFQPDSDQLTDRGRAQLRQLRDLVDGARSLRVVGHADATGAEAHNRELSERRAAVVYAFLMHGLHRPPPRHAKLLRGETRPVASNETAEGRKHNRRVSILVRLIPPSA